MEAVPGEDISFFIMRNASVAGYEYDVHCSVRVMLKKEDFAGEVLEIA